MFSNIQSSIRECAQKSVYGRFFMKYAAVFLYIYIADAILGMTPLPSFIHGILNWFSAILYFLYIIGVVFSFAKNDTLPLMIIFAFKTISPIISMLRYGIYFNNVVYVLVYGFITYWIFTELSKEKSQFEINTEKKFCPNCGQSISSSTQFCGNCGEKCI